jgi:hypothetical protein
MVFGQCKDMMIKFVNGTGLTIIIPSEPAHERRVPGPILGHAAHCCSPHPDLC